MSMKSSRWTCVLLVAVTLASPLWAIAQTDADVPADVDGSRLIDKAFDYAVCGVSLAMSTTGVGVALAVLSCGKALNLWWTD